MRHDPQRISFLFGEEALGEIEAYDLDEESDVKELVERFMLGPGGGRVTGVHSAIRTIAARQILSDDPPEAWQAVLRMREAGLDRDTVLRQLSMVVTGVVLDALSDGEPHDPVELRAALDALPMPTATEVAEVLLSVVRAQPGIGADDHVERTMAAFGPSANIRVVEELVDRVLEHLIDGPLHWLSGDRTIVFHDTISDRVFTHRFNEAEQELGLLVVSVDLAAFGRFDVVRLPDGTELEQVSVERGHLAWHGPDGWLDDFRPGDLIAVTAAFDAPVGDEPIEATISLQVVAEPAMTDALPLAIRAAYDDEQREHGLPVSTEDLSVWLCHVHPDLFRSPLPPLSDWIDAAGLDLDANLVAHDASVWRRNLMGRRLGEMMDLVPEPHWRRVLGRAIEVLPDPYAPIDDIRSSLAECAEPEALDVLADVLIPEWLSPEDEFAREHVAAPGHAFEMVDRAIAVARRPREIATARYLACVLRERCGQPSIAAEHLARAVDARPDIGSLVERMGWYCFDRGDARGAMRWWRELEGEHPAARTIAQFLAPPSAGTKIGRNDPCWCGSGRKFKQCHQLVNELPALPDRVGWLSRKATLWVEHSSGDAPALLSRLAIAWVAGDPEADASDIADDDDDEALQLDLGRAFADPILIDTALHEGRLFTRFLHERGDLLPDDERLLAASWMTVERSVHEVVGVERGVGMTLRNLATGDVVDVRERSASREAEIGERYCARVVPDGASHQIVGGVFPVRTGHEEAVLDMCAEGDPVELCAWAGALAQPTRIVHRPGLFDEMFDRDAIGAALDAMGDADEATVLERLGAEISRQAQAQWLEESIPALGGLTPRQAAADPTRREQLERLLSEFERMDERMRQLGSGPGGPIGGPITYDVAWLRRELGLA